jgi:hypothetical protein
MKVWVDLIQLAQNRQMAGAYELDKERRSVIEGWEFLKWMSSCRINTDTVSWIYPYKVVKIAAA